MLLAIDEGFTRHPKTLRFCELMGNPWASSCLIQLWTWACRNTTTGDLSYATPAEIEFVSGYRQLDGKCYAALVAAGFVDESAPGQPSQIHGWMEHTGAAIKRAEIEKACNAERQRRHRASRVTTPDVTRYVTRDMTVTSRVTEANPAESRGNPIPVDIAGLAPPLTGGRGGSVSGLGSGSVSVSGPSPIRALGVSDPDPDLPNLLLLTPCEPDAPKQAYSPDFSRVWDSYPRKVGKGAAYKAWQAATKGNGSLGAKLLADSILGALEWQRETADWRKEGGQFVPHLATYLRAQRWLDEPVAVSPYGHLSDRTRKNIEGVNAWLADSGIQTDVFGFPVSQRAS